MGTWNESSVTWNNQPGTTTAGRLWVGPSISTTENLQLDLTTFVQNWVSNPTTNFGLKMILENEVYYRSRNYASKEHPTVSLRPKLEITYSTPIVEGCITADRDQVEFSKLPWFDNNQFLYDFLDSVGYPLADSRGSTAARVESQYTVRYRIPINYIVYRDNAGNGGPDDRQLQILTDRLNEDHTRNRTGFRFYQACAPTYVDNSNRLRVGAIETWWIGATTAEAVDNFKLNVHIVENINGASGVYTPMAPRSVFIERNVYGSPGAAGTLTHEVGHFFNLDHTHQYQSWRGWPNQNCVVEPIDRNRRYATITLCQAGWKSKRLKCESTGDALCDTPADPKINGGEYSSCLWTRNLDDIYGDNYLNPPAGSFSPDPTNIMSYGASCRENFSRGQVATMVHAIEKGRRAYANFTWRIPLDIDTYEPDNSSIAARDINPNEPQLHTFHDVANCDSDWAQFRVTTLREYVVKTSAYNNGSVDTQLSLYRINADKSLTLITSNDDSNGTVFSYIQNTLTPGVYGIEVRRKPPIAYEYYYLSLYECSDYSNVTLNGPDVVCSSNTSFTISNMPIGASVLWSFSSGLSMVSAQGASTGIFRANAGSFGGSISAKITQACGVSFMLTKTLNYVGIPPYLSVTTSDDRSGSYSYHTATAQQISGTQYSDYRWYNEVGSTATTLITTGFQLNRWPIPPGTAKFYQLQVTTACGITIFRGYAYNTNPSGYQANVYPNPAANQITVETSNNSEEVDLGTDLTEVTLYNNSNEKVYSMLTAEPKLEIPVSGLPPGPYIIRIVQHGREAEVKQILIK